MGNENVHCNMGKKVVLGLFLLSYLLLVLMLSRIDDDEFGPFSFLLLSSLPVPSHPFPQR